MFLDKDSLEDRQNWLGGSVTGLLTSMIFVPLLSWTEDDQGSLGGLSKIGADSFDRVSRPPPPPVPLVQSFSLNLKSGTRTPKPETRELKPKARNPKPETLHPKPSALKPSNLNPKP